MSSSVDILSLKFLGYILVEVCITIGYVSLEFRKEVRVRNMNLGIIYMGAVADTQIIAEIIQ